MRSGSQAGGGLETTQTYVFRIKTRNGGTVPNIVKLGTSQADAERKLRHQYPDATIVDVQVR